MTNVRGAFPLESKKYIPDIEIYWHRDYFIRKKVMHKKKVAEGSYPEWHEQYEKWQYSNLSCIAKLSYTALKKKFKKN